MANNSLAPAPEDLTTNIPALYENLVGNQGGSKFQLTLTRAEAAQHLWSNAHTSNDKCSLIVKTGCLPFLCSLLDKDGAEGKYVALGCLSTIAAVEECLMELLATCSPPKVVSITVSVLESDHDRSKLPAADLLARIVTVPTCIPLVESAIPGLVTLLGLKSPRWAQIHLAHVHAAKALTALAVHESEAPDVRFKEKMQKCGVVPHLIRLIRCGNETTSVEASECIGHLSSHPYVARELVQGGYVKGLVGALLYATPEQEATLSTVFHELSQDVEHIEPLFRVGAVEALASIVREAGAELAGKAKKGAVNLPTVLDKATVAASGALWNLSQLDEVKQVLGKMDLIPQLVLLMRCKNPKVLENARGTLWNVGLDARNAAALTRSQAPHYLIQPLPPRWLSTDIDSNKINSQQQSGEINNDALDGIVSMQSRGLV